jgi:hypothetical protein
MPFLALFDLSQLRRLQSDSLLRSPFRPLSRPDPRSQLRVNFGKLKRYRFEAKPVSFAPGEPQMRRGGANV